MEKVTQRKGLRKWLPLIILSFALMIIILDSTILNVSLRTIINDLHTNIQSIQWVITAYSLMLSAFTVTGGRLGDIFGRKKMFVLGAIIFAIGSFMTSISHSVGFMIAGEAIVEGIGAAMMLPATTSLLVSNYRGRDRQIGFGIWGGIAAGAVALGPVVGGWLTTYSSWRWAFRINVGVAALLVIGSFFISEMRDREENATIDFGGIVLSALGLFLIAFGFIKASDYGWFVMKASLSIFGLTFAKGGVSLTPIVIIAGLIILSLFVMWENYVCNRNKTPLVSLKLFKNSQFTTAVSITTILALGQAGLSFALPIFLQGVIHLNAFDTGIAMLPMSIALFVASPLSAYISKYVAPKRIIQAGIIVDALGFLALRGGVGVNVSPWALAPGLLLFGMGLGVMVSQASNMALSAVSVEQSGEASGVNSTMRTVGQTLGTAILGALLISILSTTLVSGINNSSVIPSAQRPAIAKAVGQQTSNIEFGSGQNRAQIQAPKAINLEITQLSKSSTVSATQQTLLAGVGFIILAFLVSIKLPKSKNIEIEQSVA